MNKPNKKGCIPTGDVCMRHEEPLICIHGCTQAVSHKCKEIEPTTKSGGDNK
jgi:hypothetical protein